MSIKFIMRLLMDEYIMSLKASLWTISKHFRMKVSHCTVIVL